MSSNSGCKKLTAYNSDIQVHNNSSKSIYFSWGYSFPDTTLLGSTYLYNPAYDPVKYKIEPNSSAPDSRYESPESFFEHNYPSGKACFFIFDATVLETINWDTVRAKYLILKRYDFTLDSLKKLNWIITYP